MPSERRLLRRTGLAYWLLPLGFACLGTATAADVTVELAGAASPPIDGSAAAAPVQLAPVEVKAFRRRYLDANAGTALGFDVPVSSIPLSVVTISEDVLDDQQINNVEDALRNVAAATKFKQGNGGEEKFSIRGFDASQNLYVDGARINNQFNATNIATTETANIERYEILKGPASLLYGQGLPGGIVNYVTKKPRFQPYAKVEAIYGSFDYTRIEADGTAPFTKWLAGRGVVSFQDSRGFRDEDSRNRLLLNPSLRVRLGVDTTLDLAFSYIRDHYTQDRGQSLAQREDGSYFYSDRIDPIVFLGVPGWNERTRSEYLRPTFNLTHQVLDAWRLEVIGAATRVEKQLFDSSPGVVRPDGTVVIRPAFQGGDGATEYLRVNNEFTFGTPSVVEHRVLLSAVHDTLRNDAFSQSASNSVIYDSNSRTYSGLDFTLNPATSPFGTDSLERSVSLQDLVTIHDRYTLLFGVGYNNFRDQRSGERSEAVTPRLGGIWKPVEELSLYASHALGFVPNAGAFDAEGNGLDPQNTEQTEVGLKWSPLDGRLLATLALFDLRQRNQAVTDPASLALPPAEQFSTTLGETKTRGFDMQLIGDVTPGFRVIAGYAFLDNTVVDDGPDLGNDGNRLPGIPKHSGSVFGVYEFNEGLLRGLGFGGGLFAQSGTPIGFENVSRYGGWTQIDLLGFYKIGGAKLQVNVKNLFDRDYLLTQALAFESLAAARVGTSTPRTATVSLAYEF